MDRRPADEGEGRGDPCVFVLQCESMLARRATGPVDITWPLKHRPLHTVGGSGGVCTSMLLLVKPLLVILQSYRYQSPGSRRLLHRILAFLRTSLFWRTQMLFLEPARATPPPRFEGGSQPLWAPTPPLGALWISSSTSSLPSVLGVFMSSRTAAS